MTPQDWDYLGIGMMLGGLLTFGIYVIMKNWRPPGW